MGYIIVVSSIGKLCKIDRIPNIGAKRRSRSAGLSTENQREQPQPQPQP